MATLALLAKDVREHRVSALLLALGYLAVVLLLLAQNKVADYSMSSFEIVRIALLRFIPLVVLIVGNRLVVREYMSGTRLFVEALPIGQNLPLFLKYFTGLLYLFLLSVAMVLLSAQAAGLGDNVTLDYVLLIIGKTLIMVWLYWSIVFCYSLCGYLRVALYLVTAALVALIAFFPGIHSENFPPFALMGDQLFVFERDLIPWADMAGTGLLSLAFTLAGFILSRIGEGSLVERLAKPMTRRDFVALGVLAAAGLAIWTTMFERQQREPVGFSSEYVVRLTDPLVSVLYLQDNYADSAKSIAKRISDSLIALQATLSLEHVSAVKLVLAPGREKFDIEYATADGVLITTNWLENDDYDNAILDAVIMHGVLSAQTGERAMFEPFHWVLDGFTRWWVEQGTQELDSDHRSELIARSLWVLDSEPSAWKLISRWQLTADRFAYASAESLAWSAMTFLEESQGREKVIALALEFLTQPLGSTVIASIVDRQNPVRNRIKKVTGEDADVFFTQWRDWLEAQRSSFSVQEYLEKIPPVYGEIVSESNSSGVHSIRATYRMNESGSDSISGLAAFKGQCILKHEYLGPFDSELDVSDDFADIVECQTGTTAHVINSRYAPGDRVFVALDFIGAGFHQPLRLHAERLSIQ